MWEIVGILITIVGIIITIIIFYAQKTTKKQNTKKEIVDFLKLKIQTKDDISAQYIGAETASICRKNRIQKIEIVEIIEDLISEFSVIRTGRAKQIKEKLISLRAEIALTYCRNYIPTNSGQIDLANSIIAEKSANSGRLASENEHFNSIASEVKESSAKHKSNTE